MRGTIQLCDCLQLIFQPFRRFTYVTAHSPTLLLLHLHHSSFSNPSFASPTSQISLTSLGELIFQLFRHFTYVTAHFPSLLSLYLRLRSLPNLSVASPTSQLILQISFASPTSQALHLRHLASRPWIIHMYSHNYSVTTINAQLKETLHNLTKLGSVDNKFSVSRLLTVNRRQSYQFVPINYGTHYSDLNWEAVKWKSGPGHKSLSN